MIETERLILRKPTVADVDDPPPFLADPRVMDFLGGVGDPQWVVASWLEDWGKYPAGKFIVETQAAGRIGRVGVNFYDPVRWTRSSLPDAVPELTWAIAFEQWGRGYATEAAGAVRDWFAREGLISLIVPTNERSQAVARRLGATPEKTVELPGYGDHVVWTYPR